MTAIPKSVALRAKAAEQRQHIFELAEKYEEQRIFERLPEDQRENLDYYYRWYQQQYGPVSYQYWLRAVVRSMKENIKYLNKVLVFELLGRNDGDKKKLQFLEVMAKQMGMDVTITNNRVAKPVKKKKIPPIRQSYE